MRIDEFDAVAAEIRAEFEAYEVALQANDVSALIGFFWEDAGAVRLALAGGLYGHDQIAAFRKGRDTADLARTLSEIRINVLSPEIGVATCEFRRTRSGRRGAQSQVWVRKPEGWRIVSAHVSLEAWSGMRAIVLASTANGFAPGERC